MANRGRSILHCTLQSCKTTAPAKAIFYQGLSVIVAQKPIEASAQDYTRRVQEERAVVFYIIDCIIFCRTISLLHRTKDAINFNSRREFLYFPNIAAWPTAKAAYVPRTTIIRSNLFAFYKFNDAISRPSSSPAAHNG
jgi:hypothetical protein